MTRAVSLLAVALAALLLTGCTTDVTQARVEAAVGPTFANLYELQQSLLGHPAVVDPRASAQCQRTGRGVPNHGAGGDWICQLALSVHGQYQSTFVYELQVRADSCYEADGSPTIVGGAMLTTPDGSTRVNPLFLFYGCFDK